MQHLLDAADEGNVSEVDHLLENGAPIECPGQVTVLSSKMRLGLTDRIYIRKISLTTCPKTAR